METKRFCQIVYEIFKTANRLNLVFMKDIVHYSRNVTRKKHNLYIHTQNTTKIGNKGLRAFGSNIWNTLPEYIKSITPLLEFKKFIENMARTKIQMQGMQMRIKLLLKHILIMHNILQRCIQSPAKHLRWSFLRKELLS